MEIYIIVFHFFCFSHLLQKYFLMKSIKFSFNYYYWINLMDEFYIGNEDTLLFSIPIEIKRQIRIIRAFLFIRIEHQ